VNGSVAIRGPRAQGGQLSGSLLVVLLFAVAAAGVAWVYVGMITRDRWPIRWLEVDGSFQRVSAEQVRTRLAPLIKGSFFTVNLDAVRAASLKLAWVESVDVQKLWPDTVKVTVREFTPLAHWTGGQLLSVKGRVFRVPGADEMQGLPWLEGPVGSVKEVFETWQRFNNVLMPTGQEVEKIRLDRRGAWFMEMSGGTVVQLGREDALPRLQRMVSSWPELLKTHDMAPQTLDLRYTNGFAVRWPAPPRVALGQH